MAEFVTIKPAKGVRIPMPTGYGLPHGAPLPAEGWTLARDAFVDRLIADGDALLVPAAAPASDAPAKPAANIGTGP